MFQSFEVSVLLCKRDIAMGKANHKLHTSWGDKTRLNMIFTWQQVTRSMQLPAWHILRRLSSTLYCFTANANESMLNDSHPNSPKHCKAYGRLHVWRCCAQETLKRRVVSKLIVLVWDCSSSSEHVSIREKTLRKLFNRIFQEPGS